jgi:hypothetical protein
MPSYIAYNGPMQVVTSLTTGQSTTAAYQPVAIGSTGSGPNPRTMLQIKAPAAAPLVIWKWGLDFDGTGTTPFRCELIETGTVAATVTAHVAAGVQPLGLSTIASQVQLGTTGTGYTSTSEGGTITVSRIGSINSVLPGNGDRNEWSLGREFVIQPGNILRVRIYNPTATAANIACYVCWDE